MDPFASQARQYALSRPTYPPRLLQHLRARLLMGSSAKPISDGVGNMIAVDIACGSGQLTNALVKTVGLGRAYGIDRSSEQLRHARGIDERVSFHLVDVKDMETSQELQHLIKVDCFTIGQALHWLNVEELFGKLRRRATLQRPFPVEFAALSYGRPSLLDEPTSVRKVFEEDYYIDKLGSKKAPGATGCMWDVDRRFVDSGYADAPFEDHLDNVERIKVLEPVTTTVREFLNYLTTWSAYQKIKHEDPLDEIATALRAHEDESRSIRVTFPFFGVFGRLRPRS